MKHFYVLIFLIAFGTTAKAADITLLPWPQNGFQASAQDWQSATDDIDALGVRSIVVNKAWEEMEPRSKKYTAEIRKLRDDLNRHHHAGRKIMLSFGTVNTTKRVLPQDMQKTNWQDPRLIERLDALFARITADNTAAPAYISLANEADIYFANHPDEIDDFAAFIQKAIPLLREKYYPQAQFGITTTFEGIVKDRKSIVQKLADLGDIAIFTYYPVIDLSPLPLAEVPQHLDILAAIAKNKKIILQEAGFPSAAAVGASAQMQADFYTAILQALRTRPQIVFTGFFMLHDFPTSMCDAFGSYYGFNSAPAAAKEKFCAFLCSLGVKTSTGAEKPAWYILKDAFSVQKPANSTP